MLAKNKTLYFRKNGFYIEFVKFNWVNISYLIRRALAFIFDLSIFIMLLVVLWSVFKINIFQSSFISLVLYWLLMTFELFLGKNKTLGLMISGLRIANFDGDVLSKSRLVLRFMLSGLYLIPIFGQIVAIISALAIILTKGVSISDLFSKTIIVNKYTQEILLDIYQNSRKEKNDHY